VRVRDTAVTAAERVWRRAALVVAVAAVAAVGAGSALHLQDVGSTLVVAALFGPLHRGVQSRVDRRFNRARYDAQRTVDDFAARLRGAVDLDQLSRELVDVVDMAVAPGSVHLWLVGARGPAPGATTAPWMTSATPMSARAAAR
jgi:hypothetical protein